MLGDGIIITVLGMTVVFLFLGFLVLVMQLISRFARKITSFGVQPLLHDEQATKREAEIALACAAAYARSKALTQTK